MRFTVAVCFVLLSATNLHAEGRHLNPMVMGLGEGLAYMLHFSLTHPQGGSDANTVSSHHHAGLVHCGIGFGLKSR
jgi:hypothetical protein